MNTKIKILLGSVALILIAGMAAGAFLWLNRPQVIILDNGTKLTLLGTDYGKRHTPPGSKATTTAARGRGARTAAFNTPTDTLVIWFRQERDPDQYPNYQLYLYDKDGTGCVRDSGRNGGYGGPTQTNEIVGVRFDAFPRRTGKFYLRAQEWGQGGQVFSEKKFALSSPVRGSFPQWSAESLPATKADDDVSVTLTKLVSGVDIGNNNNDEPDNAANKGVQATFHVERNGKPVTNWQPVSIETSDATGNHVSGWVNQNNWQGDDDVVVYQYGLWPDEPAWKIRAEFSQQSDFSDAELWTVQNIPLEPGRQQDFWNYNNRRTATNSVFAEADVNGFHLKIFPAKQFTDVSPNSQPQGGLIINANPPLPNGMRMTLVKLTDNQNIDVGNWNYGTYNNPGSGTAYRYGLRELGGATNLNLTIALHKSRFVDFTAKPTKEASTASSQ